MRTALKLGYGIGQAADGAKQAAFNTFILFYYNQVLGLPATLAGLAALIALAVDAITDPMMGQISDNFQSKWGRRHPFMFASAIPFAIAIIQGLQLFAWMVCWAIAVRLLLTLFFVPHLALGAELSSDYHERTSIIGYRVFFTYSAILSLSIIALVVFFKPTDTFENGMLNPTGYPKLGLLCGVVGAIAMLISAFSTRSTISSLRKIVPVKNQKHALFAFLKIFKALELKSFKVLFSANLLFNIMAGVIQALLIYVASYIYGFDSKYFALLTLALAISILLAPSLAKVLSIKYGKKQTLAISVLLGSAIAFSPLLIYLFVGLEFLNIKQKLLFVSFIAGLSLDIIKFPKQAEPSTVPMEAITKLAILAGPVCMLLFMATVLISNAYPLNQKRYQEIVTKLAKQH